MEYEDKFELERRWEVNDLEILNKKIKLDNLKDIYFQNYLFFDNNKEERIRKIISLKNNNIKCKRTTKIGKGDNRLEIKEKMLYDDWVILNKMLMNKENRKPIIKLHYVTNLIKGYDLEVSKYINPHDQKPLLEIEFNSEEKMGNFESPKYFGREVTDIYSNIDIWKRFNNLK